MNRTIYLLITVLMTGFMSCSNNEDDNIAPTQKNIVGHWVAENTDIVSNGGSSEYVVVKPLELRLYDDGKVIMNAEFSFWGSTTRINKKDATYKVLGKELDIITESRLYSFVIEELSGNKMVLYSENSFPLDFLRCRLTMIKK